MALVVIRTFTTRLEAEIQKGLLEANGITAFVTADDEGGAYPCLPAGRPSLSNHHQQKSNFL